MLQPLFEHAAPSPMLFESCWSSSARCLSTYTVQAWGHPRRLVMFTIHNTFWRGEYLQKGGHYILFPLSQSSLLHISVSLLVISFPSRGDGCSWLSGRNAAAPRHGSCPTAAFPCPHAPRICQAGVGAHGRTCHEFFYPSISFSSPPTVGLRACTVLLTAPVEKLRSREDTRQARENGSHRGAGSILCQPAAWTGRQSPALAGAKTRPRFTAKQSLFVWPVLPEQSSALTMSFLWLSPCRATSSVLCLTPGSLHQRLPTASLPHGWGAAPGMPGLGSLCSRLCGHFRSRRSLPRKVASKALSIWEGFFFWLCSLHGAVWRCCTTH